MKKQLMMMLVVILILSITVTAARADTPPPVTLVSGDGEGSLPPDLGRFTTRPENYVPSPDDISIDSAPTPITPVFEFVFTKRPTFYFKRDFGATKYQIEVYSTYSGSVVYYANGPGTCTTYYCSLRPDTKLHIKTYWVEEYYRWRVRSYANGWQNWSGYADFIVLSKGFYDSFLSPPARWANVSHGSFDWVNTATKSLMKAPGEYDWWSTLVAEEYFIDVDVTVRMKRKENQTNTNAVFIWADLLPTSASNILHDGVYFQYANAYWEDGKPRWSVWMAKDGLITMFQMPTPSEAIVPFGWNELRIVGQLPFIDLWINGTYLGWIEVSSYPSGLTGVSMYDMTAPSGPLLVDWVRVTSIPYGITMEHDPAMQLGLDARPATLEEVSGSK